MDSWNLTSEHPPFNYEAKWLLHESILPWFNKLEKDISKAYMPINWPRTLNFSKRRANIGKKIAIIVLSDNVDLLKQELVIMQIISWIILSTLFGNRKTRLRLTWDSLNKSLNLSQTNNLSKYSLEADNNILTMEVLDEKIFETAKQVNTLKAPSPDGM